MEESRMPFAADIDSIGALLESALSDIRNKLKLHYGGFTEPVLAFLHAVDWSEPWLIALVAFYVLALLLVIKSRRNSSLQMTMFLFGLLGVFFAERLNSYLGKHWTSFSRQAYFDKYGVFISTVWSGPLLVLTSIILVNSLFTLTSLMVKWKRAELKYRARLAQHKSD